MNRIAAVAKVQQLPWQGLLVWPWGVLGISFTVNLVIAAGFVRADLAGVNTTGGLVSIYIVMFIGYTQSVTQYLPFLLGMGVTRRAFFGGSVLQAAVEAVAFGSVLYLLSIVEGLTGGWWVSLRFFRPAVIEQEGAVLQWLVYVVPFLFVAALGIAFGVLSKRWGGPGWLVLLSAVGAVTAVLGTVVQGRNGWSAIGSWFADQSAADLFAGWPLLLSAAVAAVGYLGLRRTPA